MTMRDRVPFGATVESLIHTADIEVIPMKGAEEKVRSIGWETGVAITCSPKFGLARTVEHSTMAALRGHTVIPHIAARQLGSEAELKSIVGRLGDAGITRLFVVGGDASEAAGPYRDATELLDALTGFDHRIDRIGVGCYPEGHATISDELLLSSLQSKARYADYMVSQLCFDSAALLGWLRRMRALGIELPLRVGLAAPLKTQKLIELSLKIGVTASLRFVKKQNGLLGNMLFSRSYRPEQLLRDLGSDLQSAELNIEGVHLFSFNQIDLTVEWQRRIASATSH